MNYAQNPLYADFLLSNFQSDTFSSYLREQDIPFQDINPLYKQIWFPLDQLSPNLLKDALYTSIPKLYLPQSLTALDSAGILQVQNRASLALTGEGILLGILDSGIAYTHPAFRDPYGNTRIAALWDQREETREDAPFGYGRLYSASDIQQALDSDAPYTIVPSRDDTGHGTAMAGIAAGSEDATAAFCGVAPQSQLAVVRLKLAKPYLLAQACLREDIEIYSETDLLCGIAWLMALSRDMKKPLVICLSTQSWQGSHDGSTALENTLDYLSTSPGLCFVTGTGNEADQQHHDYFSSYGKISYAVSELLVEEGTSAFSLEMWAPPLFGFSLSLTSPSGDRIGELIPRLGSLRLSFPLDDTVVELHYETFRSESGNQLVYMRFLAPAPGIWTIRIEFSDTAIAADLHLWLPPSETVSGSVRFLRSDPFTTAMSPANTPSVISSAPSQTGNTATISSAGRGYNFSGMQVPTLAAPGEMLLAPSYISGYTTFTGSSCSAALTAGAAALIMGWGKKVNPLGYLSTIDIRTVLLRGCNRPAGAAYPNPQSGYGYLDLEESFLNLF